MNCKNWFDPNDNENSRINISRNYVVEVKDKEEIIHSELGFEYYTYRLGSYEKHTLDNDVIDDCTYNYTDYIAKNSISNGGAPFIWYNHDLSQDLSYYGNVIGTLPFNPLNETVNTIQETYCCLPPDFLYGCTNTVVIDSIFANTNIIGVIPRNLTKKIKDCLIPNIFRNVNIMPNLEYYYDMNGSLNDSIFVLIFANS